MNPAVDLESMYSNLVRGLQDLASVLLHAQEEALVNAAFRDAGKAAIELFHEEEQEMVRTACPALELNRAGHAKFSQNLSNLYAQVRAERSGVRAAGDVRRELIPWLQEHHAVVDRQLEHHLKRLAAPVAEATAAPPSV